MPRAVAVPNFYGLTIRLTPHVAHDFYVKAGTQAEYNDRAAYSGPGNIVQKLAKRPGLAVRCMSESAAA